MNKRVLGNCKRAAGNLGEPVSDRNVPLRDNEFTRLPLNTSSGADGGTCHHSKVRDAAAYGGEEEE
ncbi:hypothetical protein [Bradyrhizobium sp. Ce-3]|uniref:hypothetical protein n=1 Tax=Bradyrhizobium sp. Ce-3 TaxID=2913970 RepID=UPI001FC7FC99|nr:hypothetical protein [Bradyrhizobium sp. Ce-3]